MPERQGIGYLLPDWLQLITPQALPLEPLPRSRLINWCLWKRYINKIDKFIGDGESIIVIGKPSVMALTVLERFKRCLSLYDAMDNFPAFYHGISRKAMQRRERKLAKRVDAIWVSSTALWEHWSKYRKAVQLVPNGFDPSNIVTSDGIDGVVKHRVFGYVGTVGAWFDWDWLIALANLRKNDIVRIIGPIFSSPKVRLPSNIQILPPCDSRAALCAMKKFDVGLIPFKENILTEGVDPIKFYEYRASDIPVISTNFGEMKHRKGEPGTFISKNIEDIEAVVEKALYSKGNSIDLMEFIESYSWGSRFDASNLHMWVKGEAKEEQSQASNMERQGCFY